MTCLWAADILRRLSPYLRRNTPLDILDLWPGAGLWSSKVNEFLQPRRHVLVESDMRAYARFLEPLARSKPCYELTSMDESGPNDWGEIFTRYLPEQGANTGQELDILPENDTLLVLANPPGQRNIRDHFTPARWWAGVMESCLKQQRLHMYGSVRILAFVPTTDAQDILPRSSSERRRPSVMTENVALHAWEAAIVYEREQWHNLKQLELIEKFQKRVAERTAARNVTFPEGREPPPLKLAPQSPPVGANPRPYLPRLTTDWHEEVAENIRALGEEGPHASPATRRKRSLAIQKLNQDQSYAAARLNLTKIQMRIDERTQNLSRAAADPQRTSQELAVLDGSLRDLKRHFAETIAGHHYRAIRGWDREVDDWRMANMSNNLDDSALLWDRRPFEPLRIHPGEIYPRESRNMIYFEADAKCPVVKKLNELPEKRREEIISLFDSISLSFTTRGNMPLEELVRALLPGRSINEIVEALPSLAVFAGKQLKPGSGVVALDDPTMDAHHCFQENIDYDLSDVRLRCMPVMIMWEILLEYQRHSLDLSPAQFGRLLGSTTTSTRAPSSAEPLKLR